MYNLNVNVSSAGTAVSNLLAVESACSTPRTPEILNSLIAMTNPLDNYSFGGEAPKVTAGCPQAVSNDSNSSSSTQGEAGPTGAPQTTPPSVQHTCSQLIKAGLKLSIESKRKHSADNDDLLDLDLNAKRLKKVDAEDDDGDRSRSPNQGLTPEDEERRRRRRERNKIAATKCRLKKREKTVNLVHESEVLENQNIDLKSQIQELESQRRRLVDMLTMHTPSCMKQGTNSTDRYNQARERFLVTNEDDNQTFSPEGPLPPVTSLSTPVIESSLVYNRSGTVEVGTNSFRSQNLDGYSGPIRVISIANENSFTRTNIHYPKAPPTIIVEDECYSPPSQITNLDNNGLSYHYNTQQCHNYNSSNGTNQNYNSPNMDNGCMA